MDVVMDMFVNVLSWMFFSFGLYSDSGHAHAAGIDAILLIVHLVIGIPVAIFSLTRIKKKISPSLRLLYILLTLMIVPRMAMIFGLFFVFAPLPNDILIALFGLYPLSFFLTGLFLNSIFGRERREQVS
ncbi:MAG: hypothetical protein AAF518_24740 [Spirochaetota bacterium]